MLCTQCGKNQARTYVLRTAEGERSVSLCPDCYRARYGREPSDGEKVCPVCGLTLAEFRKTGLLGCAGCYSAFREELIPTVKVVQGRLRHTGKDPVRALADEREELEEELSVAQKMGDRFMEQRIRYRLSVIDRLMSGGEE